MWWWLCLIVMFSKSLGKKLFLFWMNSFFSVQPILIYCSQLSHSNYFSRDANLCRSKIWRLSFFTNPPEFQRTPTPTNWPSPQWEWLKNAPETVLQIRKIEVLSLNWAKSRNKAQKSSKDDFIREIWWPVRETGRSAPYPGDSRIIWESWRVCFS